MAGMPRPNRKPQKSGLAFTPDEFAGRESDVPSGRLLSMAAHINDLLLGPSSQAHLFNSIAQVYAETLSHPIVAILLFDEDRQEVRVAGINDGQMALLKQGRGPDLPYKHAYPLADVEQLDWMRAISNGDIHISNSPVELLVPFVSSRSMGTLVRRSRIVQGLTLPLTIRGKLVGALKVGSARHELDLLLLETFADYATIALSNARLYTSLQQREGERSRLLHQLLTSQDAERRRVAVDIHDGPLQSIAVNMLAVDRARKLVEMGRTDDARNELVEVHNGMAEIVQELRDLISDLRPAVLESLGLAVAAAAHLDQFTTQTGIVSYLEDERDGKRVPTDIEVIFYRLLQEATTNVRKHSGATTVWVRFSIYDSLFRMDVTDNGRGFDPVLVAAQSLENGHIGLHSMQERIESAGGGMEIDSFQGKGTRITFWTPIIEGEEPQRAGNDEDRPDADTR